MADIKLDIAWDIEGDGSLSVWVHPLGNPELRLGQFELDDESFMDALEADIQDVRETGETDDLVLWDTFATFMEEMAATIREKTQAAYGEARDTRRGLLVEALKRKMEKTQ